MEAKKIEAKNKIGDKVTTTSGAAGVVKAVNYPKGKDKAPEYDVTVTSSDKTQKVIKDALKG
jgi:preprotein translocase subunit YajC